MCLLYCRLLFWNDQGNGRIEMSGPDGQNRQTLVDHNVTWANQMAVVATQNVR